MFVKYINVSSKYLKSLGEVECWEMRDKKEEGIWFYILFSKDQVHLLLSYVVSFIEIYKVSYHQNIVFYVGTTPEYLIF